MDAAEIFLNWRQLAEADPAILTGITGNFNFQIGGERWHVLSGPPCVVGKGATSGSESCTLRLSAQSLGDIVRGDLNPQQAFLSGLLQITGNSTTALKAALTIDRLAGRAQRT